MTICTTQDHNQVQLSPADKAKTVRQPASNIINYEQQVELQLAIPGVAKDAVNLTSEGNKLRIEAHASGNGPWGNVSYQREFTLHKDLNAQDISANLRNGILSLTIPKHEQATPQRIEIQ